MKLTNDIKTLLGLLIVTVIVGINGYFTNTPINKNILSEVTGTLKEYPYHGDQGGDMPREYIRFKIQEDDKKYYLIDCSYNVANKKDILGLKPGSSLSFFIKKSEKDKEKIYPYSLYLQNSNKYLLSLADYNRCYTKKWKLLIPIAVVIMLILGYRLLKKK